MVTIVESRCLICDALWSSVIKNGVDLTCDEDGMPAWKCSDHQLKKETSLPQKQEGEDK